MNDHKLLHKLNLTVQHPCKAPITSYKLKKRQHQANKELVNHTGIKLYPMCFTPMHCHLLNTPFPKEQNQTEMLVNQEGPYLIQSLLFFFFIIRSRSCGWRSKRSGLRWLRRLLDGRSILIQFLLLFLLSAASSSSSSSYNCGSVIIDVLIRLRRRSCDCRLALLKFHQHKEYHSN